MQEYPLLNDSELDATQLFSSLQDALSNPEECYQLELVEGAETEEDLQNALPQLNRLQIFILSNNDQIKQLPAAMGNLQNLQYLEVRDSALTSLPDMGDLEQMTDLVIDGCPFFTHLPDYIANWTKMAYLEISRTGIESLPENLGNLKRLEDLNVNQNKLKALPDSTGELSALKTLRIYGNFPMDLPNSMTHLQKLEVFDHGRYQVGGLNNVKFEASLPGAIFQLIPTHEEDFRGEQS